MYVVVRRSLVYLYDGLDGYSTRYTLDRPRYAVIELVTVVSFMPIKYQLRNLRLSTLLHTSDFIVLHLKFKLGEPIVGFLHDRNQTIGN